MTRIMKCRNYKVKVKSVGFVEFKSKSFFEADKISILANIQCIELSTEVLLER